MTSSLRIAAIAAVAWLAACASSTGADRPSASATADSLPAKPRTSIRALLDVCWPEIGSSTQRMTLTFIQRSSTLKDVMFEPQNGAPNSAGRCMQEIAWRYPWSAGELPDTWTLTPPEVRPSGWTYLDYLGLIARGPASSADPGLRSPAPLVRACLEHEGFRPEGRYRIQTNPVRVSMFSELARVDDPMERRTESESATTDAERCVQAVLSATEYSAARNFEFEFSDMSGAPPAAPAAEVAWYFAPATIPTAAILPEAVHDAMGPRQHSVADCWEHALQRRSGLYGGRSIRMFADASGRVTAAQIVANNSSSPDEAADYFLDRCLVEAVRPVLLPPVPGGAQATYSWVFARR